MQNEYGLSGWKAILGIEILNEGGGLSVDDITNEEQSSYVARTTTAWVPWGSASETQVIDSNERIFSGSGLPQPGVSSINPFSESVADAYSKLLNL